MPSTHSPTARHRANPEHSRRHHHLTAADPLTPEAEEILTALSIPTGH